MTATLKPPQLYKFVQNMVNIKVNMSTSQICWFD